MYMIKVTTHWGKQRGVEYRGPIPCLGEAGRCADGLTRSGVSCEVVELTPLPSGSFNNV